MSDLMKSIEKIHTTPMGEVRIRRNLKLENCDVVQWGKNAIESADIIMRLGKNWYVYFDGVVLTVNANSFGIITAHKICGRVRTMTESDHPCLNEFLYQAIYVSDGEAVPPRDIIYLPEIFAYIKDFGKQKGDLGVVAEQNGQVVGAAWTRIMSGYGHIDDQSPELAVSILPEFRGCGIGSKLLKKLFTLLKNEGYAQTSLSVQKDNRAVEFYKRLGYGKIGDKVDSAGHEDFIMVKRF